MTHDWGSLGRWTGVTTFMPREGSQRPEEEFQYTHRMSYSAPPEASEGPGGLPLRITAAHFEPLAAGGTIDYDSAAGRVRTAAERFAVRGVLEASALGQPVEVQLEETQFLEITLTDQR